VESGNFCVKLFVKSKLDGFEWILVGVYGAAQEALKPDCESESPPMLVGGDFNIIRRKEEKK
jgi:hypothetical protein